MCPRCGVKLQTDMIDSDIVVYHCPICRQDFVNVDGKTERMLKAKAYMKGRSLEEEIEEYIKDCEEKRYAGTES